MFSTFFAVCSFFSQFNACENCTSKQIDRKTELKAREKEKIHVSCSIFENQMFYLNFITVLYVLNRVGDILEFFGELCVDFVSDLIEFLRFWIQDQQKRATIFNPVNSTKCKEICSYFTHKQIHK